MSFGLGISFGRLCRRKRSLDEVYAEAPRIGWPESRENPIDIDPKLRAELMCSMDKLFAELFLEAIPAD